MFWKGIHKFAYLTADFIEGLGKSITGKQFFVDSTTGSNGYTGDTPKRPFATLDYAIGKCTASKGDVIWVMPGHSESTTTANAELFDLDVAGVSVIGLGEGDKRPTFTLGVATATVVMGASGCRLSNIILVGNISDLAAGLEIEAAATGCRVDHCTFKDSATDKDMLKAIAVTADADRLIIEDCQFLITVGGEATHAIDFAGGCDGLILRRNYLLGDWKDAGGAIDLAGAASSGIMVHDNFMVNADAGVGLCMDIHASTTGGVFRNFAAGSKANTEPISGGEACHFGENYGNDAVATTGILTPSTATAWN